MICSPEPQQAEWESTPASAMPAHPLLPTLPLLALGLMAGLLAPPALRAQLESFLVGPGSSVGPATKVKPKNCVTASDGSITCDTELENSPSDTQAKPQFELFNN
jgi:hypothetical protein